MQPDDLLVLPVVTKVTGFAFDHEDYVKLQYQSGNKLCEIRFPIDEVLQMEEWFIMFRRQFRDAVQGRLKGLSTST
jgi:hypothetical protein